jgi:hypothetical protein
MSGCRGWASAITTVISRGKLNGSAMLSIRRYRRFCGMTAHRQRAELVTAADDPMRAVDRMWGLANDDVQSFLANSTQRSSPNLQSTERESVLLSGSLRP